ncbi:MAG: alpha/beta hydrolase [Pseudomonadales bacterium]|nr:alpha/beta hydrolase [Pseudomonadales bacterium]
MIDPDYKNLSRYVSSYLGRLQTHSVDIDGQECKYLEGGEGEAIVFLHGVGGSKVLWRSFMQSYVGRYRVVAVDVPGLCVDVPFKNKKHSFRELSHWLALFLEKIQASNVHLVAHCVGCCVASSYASLHPQKVKSIALLNHLDVISEKAMSFDTYMIDVLDSIINKGGESKWDEFIGGLFYSSLSFPVFLKKYRERYLVKHRDHLATLLIEVKRQFPLVMGYWGKIESPVLTISSSHDLFSSVEFFYSLKTNIPSGQHELLESCGHVSFLEKSEDVLAIHSSFLKLL